MRSSYHRDLPDIHSRPQESSVFSYISTTMPMANVNPQPTLTLTSRAHISDAMSSKSTPRSPIHQWVIRLTYTSIALSLLVVGTDASTHLAMSWNSSPGVAALCILHHTIILVLSSKEKNKTQINPYHSHGGASFPVIAKIWNIICTCIFQLLWLLVLGVAITGVQWKVRGSRKSYLDENKAMRPVVLVFIILESVVLVIMTTLAAMERTMLCRKAVPLVEVTPMVDLTNANRV